LSLGTAGTNVRRQREWHATAVLPAQIVGNTPNDPRLFAVVTLLLVIVAFAACLIPTRRAARLDPLVGLRNE
jgi:ABC-type lipoprotein release transport system permease subunit